MTPLILFGGQVVLLICIIIGLFADQLNVELGGLSLWNLTGTSANAAKAFGIFALVFSVVNIGLSASSLNGGPPHKALGPMTLTIGVFLIIAFSSLAGGGSEATSNPGVSWAAGFAFLIIAAIVAIALGIATQVLSKKEENNEGKAPDAAPPAEGEYGTGVQNA